MANKIEIHQDNDDISIDENFLKLPEKVQKQLLRQKKEEKILQAGRFGKFFGTNTENINRYISVLICFCLLLFILFDLVIEVFIKDKQINETLMKYTFPVITLIIGYLFGHK